MHVEVESIKEGKVLSWIMLNLLIEMHLSGIPDCVC